MMQFIKDEELVDYSSIFPTFNHLFAMCYNGTRESNVSILDIMRETHDMFS